MAAPVTARQTPSGIKLDDGFSCKIAFERDPNISFWEKTVQPPGIDGGEPVSTTTMHNVTYRTKNSRKLKEFTDATVKVAYDPQVVSQIIELINEPGGITYHYPDGSTESVYGFLQKFDRDALEEGKQPEATITIVTNNQDPTTGAESAPVLVNVSGT